MITERLILWWLHCDRTERTIYVPKEHLRRTIVDAAKQEGFDGRYPWETGAEYDERINQPKDSD